MAPTVVKFEYQGVEVARLQADGTAVSILWAADSARPRFERFLRDGIDFPAGSPLAQYNVRPPGRDDGFEFLQSVAHVARAMFALRATVVSGRCQGMVLGPTDGRMRWPEDGACADISDLIARFKTLLLDVWPILAATEPRPSSAWTGPPLWWREAVVLAGHDPASLLAPGTMERRIQNGNDPLEDFLWAVLLVGGEQGRRHLVGRPMRGVLAEAATRLEAHGEADLARILREELVQYGVGAPAGERSSTDGPGDR